MVFYQSLPLPLVSLLQVNSGIRLLLAMLTGLVAWALSMAAGKYVSTSSQIDIEKAVGNNCLLE